MDLYGSLFQAARLRVLERDGNRCRTCDHDGTEHRLEVHHRHYRDGDNPQDEDLITLCVECHDLITDKMRRDRYEKRLLYSEPTYSKIDSVVKKPIFANLKHKLIEEESNVQDSNFEIRWCKPTANAQQPNC